jgi:hypothetical protein
LQQEKGNKNEIAYKKKYKEPEVHIKGIHMLFPLAEVDQFEH